MSDEAKDGAIINDQRAIDYLKSIGINPNITEPHAVKAVLEAMIGRKQGNKDLSVYKLYNRDRPLTSKRTAGKISKLYREGKFDSLILHWGLLDYAVLSTIKGHVAFLYSTLITEESILDDFIPMDLFEAVSTVEKSSYIFLSSKHWETMPAFKRIREHSDTHPIWAEIDEWKTSHRNYLDSIKEVHDLFLNDFEYKIPIQLRKAFEGNRRLAFSNDLLRLIIKHRLGLLTKPSTIISDEITDDGDRIYFLFLDGASYEINDPHYAVGYKHTMSEIDKYIREIIDSWINSASITSLLKQYLSLLDSGKVIQQRIQELDEEVLSQGFCSDCIQYK